MYELALLLITIIIADELYHAVLTAYGFTALKIEIYITLYRFGYRVHLDGTQHAAGTDSSNTSFG